MNEEDYQRRREASDKRFRHLMCCMGGFIGIACMMLPWSIVAGIMARLQPEIFSWEESVIVLCLLGISVLVGFIGGWFVAKSCLSV